MSILSWLKRRRLDDEDFQDEIRAHLAIAADERKADGEDPQSARLASLKAFGNVSLTTEAARMVWTPWWLGALGRTLLPSDEIAPGQHPVVVISDGFWRRDFGADPDIVGKTIEINSYPLTVVGVVDPAFHGTTVVYDVEVYIPVMMAPQLG